MGDTSDLRKTCRREKLLPNAIGRNTNPLKLKMPKNELGRIYPKEKTEYIQNQIDKIRDSVKDGQSKISGQTINEVSRRNSTAKAKLKATNQQERIKLGKQHF